MNKIDKKDIEDVMALSPAQEGLLFHYLKAPVGDFYLEQLCLTLTGPLDMDYFKRAWRFVVDANEMLRCYFRWETLKNPVQVILKQHDPRLLFHDFSNNPPDAVQLLLQKVKAADREEKFDLSSVPHRVTLCKMNENRWEMIISNHHILYDGWSNGIILKEFFSAYNKFARRRTPLKPVKHKYREYIAWLRDRDRENLTKTRESYLYGFDAGTGLSIKRKKGKNAAGDGHYRVTFASEAVAGLEIFTRSHKITTASLLYGAWGLLLQRYNDCGDVIFGVTVSGRTAPIKNIEDMVGLFINTIPLRIRTHGNEKTVDFLYRLNQEIRDRESDVVIDVQEELFDTLMVIENYPLEKGGSGPLTIASYSLEEKTHYDLTVGITLFDGIEVDFGFKEALLDRSSIERLASHFMNITADMVAHPGKGLRFLEILTDEEKNTLLYGFNDTRAEYPQDKTIHQLFEEQATRTPDRIAVMGSTVETLRATSLQITYRQLNEQSDRLAGLLMEKGVLADSIVGIMMDRCVEMIIGILGILKAGGAYLPIDPNYPQERIDYMLNDSAAKILLTASECVFNFHHSSFIIHHSSQLAYIIYTSGSTGKPKGVAVAHAPVVNRLYWVQRRYELNERDVVLQATSFIFDVSVCELFRWILPGGKLCFLLPGAEKDPGQIIDFIARYGTTTADFAPGMLSLILDRVVEQQLYKDLASLRWIFTGVEIVGLNLVKRFNETLHKVNKTRLIDAYGPTESTVDVTYFDCSVIGDSYEDTIPIGKPMANVCIYIVNRFGGLQPEGVYGELCIAGSGLARGYLNNPGLTAEKFKFNRSYRSYKTYINYKTGDLARWLPGGSIEFLGRIDHQVKIRGFRVETGEIEGRLLSYKEIDEAVVTSWDRGDGEKFLCAYVVSKEKIDAAMLKNKLAVDLPGYMIPTIITQLDKIPLTVSGNIDRRALPEPVIIDNGAEYIPPASLLEERLVAIWAEVLGIERRLIGAGRNFFKLGGHSLKAVRLSAGIQREFAVTIPLETIFKTPTVRGVAKYIAGQPGGQYLEIEPAEEKEYYALTPAQKRIYFMQRMAPDSTAYHLVSVMEVEGDIDKKRLEQAFVGLINRHESLRTSFHIVADQPVQRIGSTKVFAELFSKSDPPEAIIKSFIRPFDLSKAPLLRVGLLEIEEKKHLLLIDIHHIIVDGVSVEVLIKEFTVLYEGQNLAATGIRYRDFTEWQGRQRESDVFKRQKEYWLKEFAGEIPVLDLPFDFPRPGVRHFAGKTLEFEIGSEETAALNALVLEGGVTIFMALLASYNILLAKLSGREVIVVGAPGEGRPHAALEKVVGMFVNTLALKNFPCGEKPFNEFLREIKDSTLAAFAHQDFPYEELVESVGVPGDTGRNPLFDTMLALQNKGAAELEIPGLRLKPYDYEIGTAKFDLTLRVVETGEKLLFCFEYCTELFKKETVERFSGYFKKVVSGVLACPGIRLSDIEILSLEEKEEILVDFNNTAVGYPRDKTIQQLFEEQATRTPDHIALVGADPRVCPNCLTYRQLNEQSGRLAGLLQEKGVLADDIVGIMMERSIDLIIGILGILKSGGAYLPIDPEYPQERIDYMLKDSAAKILLTASGCVFNFHHSSFIVHHSNHLAYIIYTSGSTGKPKGVMVEHASVVNYILGQVKFFGITEKDRVLQFSTICFDASVEQIFIALLSGAVLVLVDKETLLEKSACEAFIVSQAITHLHAVPSFLSNIKPGGAIALKRVVSGGDVCPVSLAKWWSRYCDFYNKYGPTETTITSIEKKYESSDDRFSQVPVGKPVGNTAIYLLDRWLKPVPRGAAGEIYIGGAGVARGYLNNPELTVEKFKFNRSYRSYKTYINYKTGDLARWLDSGSIEFLGRIDHQVKIRGFRIELGEIENRLVNHPDIKEAVVTVRTDETGDNYLCAYIISGRQLEIPGLREYLAKDLPGYMIPSYFMQIEKIPLTPNGKINRGALPQPGLTVGESYTAPRNEIEKKLVRLWAEVLGRSIGIDDHFFQVGGHSLKAAILVAKIHKAFNVPLPLAELFAHPTIRQTGEYIKRAGPDKYISIDSAEKKEYYRLSYAQERIYTAAQLEKNSLIYNIPAVLEVSGELERYRLEKVFKRLIEKHESFRTSFLMVDGQVVQRIHDEVETKVFAELFSKSDPPEAIIKSFIRPFDLSKAPLLRIGLIKEAEQKHILMVDIHHIISDGTSTGILIRDFLALYKDDRLAHSEPLITYKDFSEWQHGSRYKEILKQRENFWRKQFEGDIPVLNMPCDYSRPLVPDHKGNGFSFELTGSEAAGLKTYAAEQEVTLYILLLSIYTVFLAKLSGQEDIVVGSPVAGRNRPELEQVIGMFVNTLALRNFPAGDIPFNRFLGEVKERTLEVFAHQDYPYEDLVKNLGFKRDAGRNPLFDVMLVLQNAGRPEIEIPGLTIKQLEHETGVSKFDLTLIAVEGGEGLTCSFEYRATLFKEETIRRFAGYFIKTAADVLEEPTGKIAKIDIIPSTEKEEILYDFNNTALEYPRDKTIQQLFEEQASKAPDCIGLVGQIALSYRQLNEQSGRLAGWLIEKGVLADSIVAIMMERSIELIIGILGILKAGGAYLPIDPEYPQERIDFMLKDSGTKLLAVANDLEGEKVRRWEGKKVLLESIIYDSNHLAYIIYTSGSTGKPKGVMIEHRSIVNTLCWRKNYYGFNCRDVVLQLPSFSFDSSVEDIFTPLISGSRLVMIEARQRFDTDYLKGLIKAVGVTHFLIAPALYKTYLDEIPDSLTGLRSVTIAGENFTEELVKRHFEKLNHVGLYNEYGPAENSVCSTVYEFRPDRAGILIGKPIVNVKCFILDKGGLLSPVGVPGELYVCGPGIARGYLNNPELTADRFNRSYRSYKTYINYKTGDLCKWLPGGNIEFLGRIDHQVKIRGQRIEPGEIETRLAHFEHIKEAVVLLKESTGRLAAYIVAEKAPQLSRLKEYLAAELPAYMIPTTFNMVEKIPLTPNGKVDRKILETLGTELETGVEFIAPRDEIEKKIAGIWRDVLALDKVGVHDNFFDLGGNSLDLVKINTKLKQVFNIEDITLQMFRYPTIRSLARYLNGETEQAAAPLEVVQRNVSAVAVIGMAGRFPGAKNIAEFWENLKNSVESVRFFSQEELEALGVEPGLLQNPLYVKVKGALLENKEQFDAAFFDYTPKEAEIMNPQARILHECAWETLENAGYDPFAYKGSIGFYAGASSSSYWESLVFLSGKAEALGWDASVLLSDKDFIMTRIAYKLNLRGPNFAVQTACSTSLAAIHLACRGLLDGECHMALAGGVKVSAKQSAGYLYQEGMIHSPDGHCRAFDAKAKGTVSGEGVGLVLLKPLAAALEDGDYIYAVVKGTAVNNDGIRKIGYTAPGVEGQAEVIRAALHSAQVEPESIGYIEAHGTGTTLGDPVEIEGLKSAFNTTKKKFCAVGSVKTNIGHLDAAAGIAGFIKTVLVLQNKLIPPSLHFETPNPKIDFENSPFYVNTTLKEWKNEPYPLRAGVSSLGIGGTNVHVILEEYKIQGAFLKNRPLDPQKIFYNLLLSAKTQSALEQQNLNLAHYLQENPGADLADVAYTLQTGRRAFQYRCMTVCSNTNDAVTALRTKVKTHRLKEDEPQVIFMFTGQGSQYVDMGLDLYQNEPVFRQEMDHCFEIIKPLMDYDVKEIIYPSLKNNRSNRSYRTNIIDQTEITQPVLFIFEYALAKLLMKWGITPSAFIGHSIGEYTAVCLAGVLSLEDALKIVVWRGRLMQQTPPGAMVSVPLPEKELKPLLEQNQLALAAVNGTSRCVVSGPAQAIAAFENALKEKEIETRRLHTSHAFHSELMDPILPGFEEIVKEVQLKVPHIPYISNLSGHWISPAEATDPRYWVKQLRYTVRFADGIDELLKIKTGRPIFIEVGPGKTLSTLVKQPDLTIIDLVRQRREQIPDTLFLLEKIGQLWLHGITIDWSAFHGDEKRKRVPLPTYPFEGRRYWIEGNPFTRVRKNRDIDDYFYVPTWKRFRLSAADILPGTALPPACWLLFTVEGDAAGSGLEEKLRHAGQDVVTVVRGTAFQKESAQRFTLNPGKNHEGGYDALFADLVRDGRVPDFIVHCWNLMPSEDEAPAGDRIEETLDLGYYSLINIARAVERNNIAKKIRLAVITTGLHEETICPLKAAVLGPVKVIPLEYPNIRCRVIDAAQGGRFLDRLITDLSDWSERSDWSDLSDRSDRSDSSDVSSYSGNYRWVRGFDPIKIKKPAPLKPGGVYLITGGLGGMGLALAQYLARTPRAKLILIGRASFQAKDKWESQVKALEASGAEVLVLSADVTDENRMREVVDRALERFGVINGIIHAAGLPDGKVIRLRTRETSEQVLAPKIKGTLVLDKIIKTSAALKPDFFIICSSLTSLAPAVGQVGYCAANNFVDAFALRRADGATPLTTAIDWDRWRNTGMAVTAEKLHKKLTGKELEGGLTVEEGIEVFGRILGNPFPQVAVSSYDLEMVIKQAGEFQAPSEMDMEGVEEMTAGVNAANAAQRPELETPYVPPRTGSEHFLAGSWSALFGYERVGIHDDFFRLGGDSLLAMAAIAKIHKGLGVKVPIAEFFNNPFIEALAVYIDANKGETVLGAIEPVEKKQYYPVSSAQKRLFILQQMEPGSVAYNQPNMILLEGEPDQERLEVTIKKLIQRHESLRTSFPIIGNEPVQRVHEENLAKVFGPTFFQKGGFKEFIRPFDLSCAPLLRVCLIKKEETNHILLFDMHHIIADGVSMGIFKRDFMRLYRGKDLPMLKVQYRDFSGQQNSWKQGDGFKKQERYWLREFEEKVSPLDLPGDYPRLAAQSFEGGVVSFTLSSGETKRLKEIAQAEGATLFMILLAVYNIFLAKLAGREDIVVGVPAAGRKYADLEPIIGMFVNTLALRNYPVMEKVFSTFLREIRERSLAAFENQDYPFEDLVENVVKERDKSRNPLFDVVFALQNLVDRPGTQEEMLDGIETGRAKFDLTLIGIEQEEALHFYFEYCSSLFKKETIIRFSGFFRAIISFVMENPAARIGDIEIISPGEKKEILYDFNNTEVEYPRDKTIQQLFAEQAAKVSDCIGLVGQARLVGQIALSYRHLNEQSNGLAGWLTEKGVLVDSIVGIMMERSIELIIGILGILKSGGAYLPIDPNYPQERIDYMLKDSGAKVLVNEKFFGGGRGAALQKSPPDSTNLAYLIYTSGSTGKPKGVMVTHRNVVRLVKNANYVPLSGETRILQTGAPVFDVATFEIWGCLLNGGLLYPAGNEVIMDANELGAALKRYFINTLWLTSALFDRLMQQNSAVFSAVKYLLVGGDVLSPRYIAEVRRRNKGLRVINGYGPTENTTFSTTFEIDGDYKENIPIGKPIANSTAYIIDKSNHLQPMGVPGELWVGGDGVARGYLNNPELTADRFNRSYRSYKTYINYKTGDLARRLADGNIEFLGRIDRQVKIRGFRIEPGEIEAHLLNHEQIKEAAVVVRTADQGEPYLCAYIVTVNPSRETGAVALREYLAQTLPAYMIPAYFVELERLPLTINGKLDRKALPEPVIKPADNFTPPRNDIEERLTQTWAEILGVQKENIGIDANFFDSGGHSLRATILAARIHKEFNVKIPLTDIFSLPTIRKLSAVIATKAEDKYAAVEAAEKKEYYPVSSAQKRLFVLHIMDGAHATNYNMPNAFTIIGPLDKSRVELAFKRLIKRHESLRTSFTIIGNKPVQRVHDQVEFEIEDFDFATDEHGQTRTFLLNFIRTFDLSRAPLLRMALLKTGEDSHVAIFDMHHIIGDGTAFSILVKEFTALYRDETLPPLKIQYKDFAQWQNRLSSAENIEKQKTYWINRFKDEIPVLNFPTDYPRPAARATKGKMIFAHLPGTLADKIRKLNLETETTLYIVLLAVYNILLARYTLQEDIIVGSPVLGREHADLHNIIGTFANMLAMRNFPVDHKTFGDFLKEVKENALKAYENQDYQFDELVAARGIKAAPGRNPLFDTVLNMVNIEQEKNAWQMDDHLDILPYEFEYNAAKYDLLMRAYEDADTIHISLEYATSLFKPGTAENLMGHFVDILEQAVQNLEQKIQDITITADFQPVKNTTDKDVEFNF